MKELLSDKDIIWLIKNKNRIMTECEQAIKKTKISELEKVISLYEKKIQEQIPDFVFKNKDRRTELIEHILHSDGSYENIRQTCPKCGKRYVLTLAGGDVYYRAFSYTDEKRKKELERLSQEPLFCNISAYKYDYDYECLNCGYEWEVE